MVRRESRNSYVPRFFSYTIDKKHNPSELIKDAPDYITLKRSPIFSQLTFSDLLTAFTKPNSSSFWLKDVHKIYQTDRNPIRVTNNSINIYRNSSIKFSKTPYYLFYQTFHLNLLSTRLKASSYVISNSFYSHSVYKNYQNSLFSLKRLNFDERYFAYNHLKTSNYLPFRQNSTLGTLGQLNLQKQNLIKAKVFGKQLYVFNISLFKNYIFKTKKNTIFTQHNSVRGNTKRDLQQTLRSYVPVFSQIRAKNRRRFNSYSKQSLSLTVQNFFFRELSLNSQNTNYDSLRQFLILSKHRKSVTQNLDFNSLLLKTKPLRLMATERQFYWDIRRDSVRTLRYLQKRYSKSSKSLFN